MQHVQLKSFGKVRNFLWPIHGYEHRKLIPMFALFFLISFVYNVLRCMKVTLVVTAEGSGAEAIPYLKVWAVLPGAILLTCLYTWLANRLNREQVFYTMISIFLTFFVVFMVFLHPNREMLELTSLSHYLQNLLPEGFKGFIAMIRHWPLTLFYVLSDLWSAVVLSMLFWGFANEVTTVNEAKRFYAIFALGANGSGIFSGQCAQLLTLQDYNPYLPFGQVAWEQSLILQLSALIGIGFVIMGIFAWVNRHVIRKPNTPQVLDPHPEPSKIKLSLRECFSHLLKSRYMTYIVILVVAYNIVYNLSDLLWTDQVHQRYPNASEFNAYMNNITSITGIFATVSALLLSGNVIRRYGWTVTAMITPILWLMTGLGFFGCLLFGDKTLFSDMMYALFSMPAYSLVLIFGSAQICLGRAAKYTVFDESKEIAFIPLPKESQRKGKAVVDGIASRFGKSGGSLMVQCLLLLCGELVLTIPYVAGIFMVVVGFWIYAVRGLGNMVNKTIDYDLQPAENLITMTREPSTAS